MNPFEREHADAWGSDFIDVPSLNSRASDHLLQMIDGLREAARQDPDRLSSHSLLVLGPAGAGKTHLFSRLRQVCGLRAAFVHMRPGIGFEPGPRHVLAECVDALQRRVFGRTESQLDLVVGSALSLLDGRDAKWPHAKLDDLRAESSERREEMISRAVDRVCDLYADANADWLARLLSVPVTSGADRRAKLVWLSGREPDLSQLARLGLKEPLPDASVLPALRTLAIVASYGTPLVVVFDQLENLIDEADESARRIHGHGRLLSELFDSVRGLVLVQMALDAEWVKRIRPRLAASERSRLESRVEALDLPTRKQRSELLALWIGRLPAEQRQATPWPFFPEEHERWISGPGVTPRMLMIACREAINRGSAPEEAPPAGAEPTTDDDPNLRLEELWVDYVDRARAELSALERDGRGVDRQRIASAILAAITVARDARTSSQTGSPFNDLRVDLSGREVDLFVVQQAHPRWAIAALDRAKESAQRRPVLAVRERTRSFPPTWTRAFGQLREFLREPNAIWLELAPVELHDLLAVHDLLAAARSQDLADRTGRPLPERVVRAFVSQRLKNDPGRVIEALEGKLPEEGRDQPPPEEISGRSARPRSAIKRSSKSAVPSSVPSAKQKAQNQTGIEDAATERPGPAPSVLPFPDPIDEAELEPDLTDDAALDQAAVHGLVARVLDELRFASVDRVVREVRNRSRDATRTDVLAALRAMGNRISWFGRELVHLKGAAA